jgi:hypothetical protein
VVESLPGLGVGAADVRDAIASELGTPVVAPRDPSAPETADVLVVALERGEIRMSLHARATGVVARTIPAPADRAGRLRAIAWLAGNLARDQVSPLMASMAGEAPQPATPSVSAVPPPTNVPATDSPRPATEPPPQIPTPSVPSTGSTAATVTVGSSDARPSPDARWAITILGGPSAAFMFSTTPEATGTLYESYQVTAQRRATPDGWILGAALDVGPSGPTPHLLGVAGFVGSDWRRRRWFLEATAGLGLEAARIVVTDMTLSYTNSSSTGPSSTTTRSAEVQPVLYLRTTGAAGVSVSRTFDVIAQLTVHVGTAWQLSDYLAATVGVRFRLP